MEDQASRRDLLLTSLMAALPLGVVGAAGSPLNPEQTDHPATGCAAVEKPAELSAKQRR